jgi:hypothetical protein
MRRSNLTELAANPNFISGIYNYCDRWCERCPFTSRCLVYAQEKEDEDDAPETRDINNEAFWKKLASRFQETRELITRWAEEEGIDLTVTEEDVARLRKRDARVKRSRLTKAGQAYASAVTDWFTESDQTISASDTPPTELDAEQHQTMEEAREVIHWYQYQIAVKTMRAISSRNDELEEDYDDPFGKDSDGSAKVALIGIDRSMGAWRMMQRCLPERANLIVPLILQLEQLRQRTEKMFPQARDFIRPGFDEILGEAN